MDRIAVFVDAGYLFAQGSAAISGSQRKRQYLDLDAPNAVSALKKLAGEKAPHCSLLRIYWYDGAAGGTRPTGDQARLAFLDDVKVRLGFINSRGQQKGVDSLIVTDLIELARLGTLSEAILLSGDEDVRVGVQIAQNYGVRVHLLGIIPCRGSQSHQLMQEADTTTEWDADLVSTFLAVREQTNAGLPIHPPLPSVIDPSETANDDEIRTVVEEYVAALSDDAIRDIKAYWETERGVPSEHDGVLLASCRSALGCLLEKQETRLMRSEFQTLVTDRLTKI